MDPFTSRIELRSPQCQRETLDFIEKLVSRIARHRLSAAFPIAVICGPGSGHSHKSKVNGSEKSKWALNASKIEQLE